MDLDVVVCVKNEAEELEKVLRQITALIPFKKLIVVYGTSTDSTETVAKKYTDQVFWDEDKGLGAARNLGIVKASSEIVTMIDSDVILDKSWYGQLIDQFKDPNCAAAIGTCIYGYGCKPIESYWEYIRHTGKDNLGCHNTMFRRKHVLNVGNFDPTIKGAGEDYDLYWRLKRAGYTWVWVRNASVYHPVGISEYFRHLLWWTRGKPYMDEIVAQLRAISLFRWYCRETLLVVKSFWVGLKISFKENPTLMFSYPAVMAAMAYARMSGLKKLSLENNKSTRAPSF